MVTVSGDVPVIENIQDSKGAINMGINDRHCHGHDPLRPDKDSFILFIEADGRVEELVSEFSQGLDLG